MILRRIATLAALLILFPFAASAETGLSVLSFNMRSARGDDERRPDFEMRHLEAVVDLIREADADVVLLQEIDRGVARSQRVDQFDYLVENTGMEGRFARTVDYQGGAFGIAVLTNLPVAEYRHVVLPQLGGKEPRALQYLRVEAGARFMVNLFNTHIDPRLVSRDQQIEMVLHQTAELATGHAILAGDLNATPSSAIIGTVGRSWRDAAELTTPDAAPPTYPSRAPEYRVDYLFFRGEGLTLRSLAYPAHRGASDHLPLLARFALAR